MKRSPMSRGTGFASAVYAPPPVAPLRRVERIGVIAQCSGMADPIAKPQAHRNRHLLDMARGKPCLLQIPLLCKDERETVVAAHSNESFHGKAGARKANDEYSVWACWRCHEFIDSGQGPKRMKTGFFQVAHMRQVIEWRAIAASASEPAKDRAAAQWALDQLNATPVGERSEA